MPCWGYNGGMFIYHIILLALIQGVTEFLPVSSSGHLVLVHGLVDGNDLAARWAENQMMDVAVHVGTLFSVLVYFYKDIKEMLFGAMGSKENKQGRFMALYVVVASIPVILAGFVLHMIKPDWIRSVEVVGWTTIIFGVFLWASDRFFPNERTLDKMGIREALLIGFAQVFALVPGTSRSGVTMTAARFFGFSRTESARFSLLLAIVAIAGAGSLAGLDLYRSGDFELGVQVGIAALLSFVSGWVSIALMMNWLSRSSFMPFVLYRMVLGCVILSLLYSGFLTKIMP